jgi:hypothetical protein
MDLPKNIRDRLRFALDASCQHGARMQLHSYDGLDLAGRPALSIRSFCRSCCPKSGMLGVTLPGGIVLTDGLAGDTANGETYRLAKEIIDTELRARALRIETAAGPGPGVPSLMLEGGLWEVIAGLRGQAQPSGEHLRVTAHVRLA